MVEYMKNREEYCLSAKKKDRNILRNRGRTGNNILVSEDFAFGQFQIEKG